MLKVVRLVKQAKYLELIPKSLSTVICCKLRGYVLSAKKVLDSSGTSEPFPPPPPQDRLTTKFSLNLVTKQVLG